MLVLIRTITSAPSFYAAYTSSAKFYFPIFTGCCDISVFHTWQFHVIKGIFTVVV